MEKVPFVDNIKELDEFIGICAVEKDLPDSLNFLKRFKIISRIDKGAHGQIMLARDLENNKLVAIKFMPRDQRHKSKFDKEINVFKTLTKYETYPVGFPELVYEDSMETFKEMNSSIDFNEDLCIFKMDDDRFISNFSGIINNISSIQNCDIEALVNAYRNEEDCWNGFAESHQFKEIYNEVEEKVSLNHSIPFRNLSINDCSDSVICISPICNQDAIKNCSKLVTKPITTDQNLVSLSQMQNQLNEASNVPNSFINQKLDNCDGQKVNLSERKDVVNRAILRGIKKFYIDLLLNFVPGYKDKRLCRVHKPTLLKDITSLCKRFMESEELPKAVFCLLRPNSIDFIAESESYKEDVLAFIDCIQRYSHKKFNSITKLKFVKVLFSHIYDCEKTLDSFVQVNSLMSKHLEAYSEGIKRFRLLLSENMQENLTESE